MLRLIVTLLFLVPAAAAAQLRLLGREELPLGTSHDWSQPVWSPDGKTVYYTTTGSNGIWAYSPGGRTATQITADPGSGFGFSIAPDGSRIAYRRTFPGALPGERLQEVVVKTIGGSSEILSSGMSVSVPSFVSTGIVYTIAGELQGASAAVQPAGTVAVLGIEDTKIAILRDGQKELLDPLGKGSYIWPSLSSDGRRLVAYEMDRGTFVATADGSDPVRIGRRDAPTWTRDGRWLVYMDDKDDGERITSSAIAFISPDGKTQGLLTAPGPAGAMFPRCSPVDDRIVCSTLGGRILVLTYAEAAR